MSNKYEQAVKILKENNQEHIINFLEEGTNIKLIEQILYIDFSQINELYNMARQEKLDRKDNIQPINSCTSSDLSQSNLEKYKIKGKEIIETNKIAIVIMAGGQGTRLGHNGPKGTFKLNIGDSEKYLFEIIIEKLQSIKNNYNIFVSCYIMTSEENNQETIEFFENNKYFGYPKENISFFKQGKLPLLDMNGKLLIGENKLIKLASNGNGGIFSSMKKKRYYTRYETKRDRMGFYRRNR